MKVPKFLKKYFDWLCGYDLDTDNYWVAVSAIGMRLIVTLYIILCLVKYSETLIRQNL